MCYTLRVLYCLPLTLATIIWRLGVHIMHVTSGKLLCHEQGQRCHSCRGNTTCVHMCFVCMCLLLIGVQAWKTTVRISSYWKKLQRKINGPTQLPRDQTNHTHPQSVVSYTTTESLLTVWLRLCPSSSFQPTATTWPDRLGYPDTTATDDKQRRTWTAHTNVSGASHQANRRPQISQTRGTTRWLPETLLPSSPITHKAGSKRCGVNKKCPYAAFLCLVPVITFPRSRWRLRSF